MPQAVSGLFSDYYWGSGAVDTEVVMTAGRMRIEDLRRSFEDVALAATIRHPYAIFHEDNIAVYVCRRPRVPIYRLWPGTGDF